MAPLETEGSCSVDGIVLVKIRDENKSVLLQPGFKKKGMVTKMKQKKRKMMMLVRAFLASGYLSSVKSMSSLW